MLSFDVDCFIDVYTVCSHTYPYTPPKVDSRLVDSLENDFTDFTEKLALLYPYDGTPNGDAINEGSFEYCYYFCY